MGVISHNGTKNVKTNNWTTRPTQTPLKPGGAYIDIIFHFSKI